MEFIIPGEFGFNKMATTNNSATTSLHKIKKIISKYFISTMWPWEIISGLFIVLILINFEAISRDTALNKINLVYLIIVINLIWAVIDGLMVLFTNLLEKGRYNKIISQIKSTDKTSMKNTISDELDSTIIKMFDKQTKEHIYEILLKKISSISASALKQPKIDRKDIFGAFLCIFFVFLPCIVILPFFLLINGLGWAILVSDIIGLAILFAFGYKLGSCTSRNKILTGIITMLIGLALIAIGIIFGA